MREMGRDSTLGTTLAYPPRPDGRGGFAMVRDEEAVVDHLRAIIESPRGSHLMEPWFGTPRLPFNPISHGPALAAVIRRAILAAEDRVDPDSLDVSIGEDGFELGIVPILVKYVIRGEGNARTMAAGYRELV